MTDSQMLDILQRLCNAYTANDPVYQQLETTATQIGEELNAKGGISEMRRVFKLLNNIRGSRTLEMHWNGIGEWRG